MKIHTVTYLTGALKEEQFPAANMPEIAMVGRSNVGKSALLNSLVNRKNLARISGSPGKTRIINFFLVNNRFYLVDLPGYGYARVSRETKESWAKIVQSYLHKRETLKLIVMLVDIRHPPTENDLDMYQWLVHFNLPTVIVATKADKISRGNLPLHVRQIREGLGLGPQGPVILFSIKTGQGKDQLWQRIEQYVGME